MLGTLIAAVSTIGSVALTVYIILIALYDLLF